MFVVKIQRPYRALQLTPRHRLSWMIPRAIKTPLLSFTFFLPQLCIEHHILLMLVHAPSFHLVCSMPPKSSKSNQATL